MEEQKACAHQVMSDTHPYFMWAPHYHWIEPTQSSLHFSICSGLQIPSFWGIVVLHGFKTHTHFYLSLGSECSRLKGIKLSSEQRLLYLTGEKSISNHYTHLGSF